MEKNIGTALLNKGQFGEAIPYFDKVLAYYGVKSPENKMAVAISVITGIIHLLIGLYFPRLKFNRIATPREIELNKIINMQAECAAFMSPSRFLTLGFKLIKKLTFLDLTKTKNGIQQFTSLTVIMSFGGISFALHRKILKFIKQKVNSEEPGEMIAYAFAESLNYRYEGNWNKMIYDPKLVDDALRVGNIQETCWHIIMVFFIDLGLGRFNMAREKIAKLAEISHVFDNYTAESWHLIASAKLAAKQRNLQEALASINSYIEFNKKLDDRSQLFWGYGTRAYIQILLEDISEAENSMQLANQYIQGEMLSVYDTTFTISQFMIDVHHLGKAKEQSKNSEWKILVKNAIQSGKKAVRIALKISDDRVESYKLMDTCHWLIGNKKKAIKWWGKAIKEGESLEALPELSRTYMEAGKRLLEEGSRHREINGISATAYLEKARKIFIELDITQQNPGK